MEHLKIIPDNVIKITKRKELLKEEIREASQRFHKMIGLEYAILISKESTEYQSFEVVSFTFLMHINLTYYRYSRLLTRSQVTLLNIVPKLSHHKNRIL